MESTDGNVFEIYQRLLIATDGSEKNISAVIEGLMIARATGAHLYAVYVLDSKPLYSEATDMSHGGIYESLSEEGGQALKYVQELAGDLTVETQLLTGNPSLQIIRFAKEKGIDLIVIGTQGKSGIGKLILGSVAESVVRSAPCSVLVVRKT